MISYIKLNYNIKLYIKIAKKLNLHLTRFKINFYYEFYITLKTKLFDQFFFFINFFEYYKLIVLLLLI